MTPEALAAELKRRGAEAGWTALRVARADALDRDAVALETWLDAGMQASMAWMERYRDRRRDPRVLLPGCRSVIVAAMNYWGGEAGESPADRGASRGGRVARYARGRDYHKTLGRALRRLADWLAEASGAPARAFVDTGPVLERAWAERAGLGWIGKNANLLRRDAGSWLLLGEILSAADVAPDAGPHAEFCGSCTACIDACPTDAIVAPGRVDARRCISYWTIEHRGPVPEPERAGLGQWIFGCDVCQEVCPWNETFARDEPGAFERRDDLAELDPRRILEMDEGAFRAAFSGTPLMRARRDGMRRNACIVMGNRRDPADRPALERAAADDPDPTVREAAAWALGQGGGCYPAGR